MLVNLLPVLIGAPVAHGHAGVLLDAVDAVEVSGESAYDIELSVGLVLLDGEEGRWVCHEAVTNEVAVQSPRYARSPSGRRISMLRDPLQARDGASVWWSEDGCEWTAATGMAGLGALSGAFDPTDASHALVIARDDAGATVLMRSTDGGASFEAVPELAGAVLHDLGVRFGSDGRAWVGATTDASRLWVFDGSWSSVDLPEATVDPVWVPAIDPGNPDSLLVVIDPIGLDRILRFDGADWSAVALEGEVVDAAAEGDDFWLILNGDRLAHTGGQPATRSW